MYGRNPAHYAEYWKAVQELWLRLYLSNMTLVSAINVSAPPHTHIHSSWGSAQEQRTLTLTFLGQTDMAEKRSLVGTRAWIAGMSPKQIHT